IPPSPLNHDRPQPSLGEVQPGQFYRRSHCLSKSLRSTSIPPSFSWLALATSLEAGQDKANRSREQQHDCYPAEDIHAESVDSVPNTLPVISDEHDDQQQRRGEKAVDDRHPKERVHWANVNQTNE